MDPSTCGQDLSCHRIPPRSPRARRAKEIEKPATRRQLGETWHPLHFPPRPARRKRKCDIPPSPVRSAKIFALRQYPSCALGSRRARGKGGANSPRGQQGKRPPKTGHRISQKYQKNAPKSSKIKRKKCEQKGVPRRAKICERTPQNLCASSDPIFSAFFPFFFSSFGHFQPFPGPPLGPLEPKTLKARRLSRGPKP